MTELGKAIREILGRGTAYVVSSPALRASDSTEVLIDELGLDEYEKIQYLWTGADSPLGEDYRPGADNLMELVRDRESKPDGLVVVTHMEVAGDLPVAFLKDRFGREDHIILPKGRAVHIDLEGKLYRYLPGNNNITFKIE
jgi:phosphohistidine phosphatase SixA